MLMDSDTLVDALRAYGVRYITGGSSVPLIALPDPGALIAGLAQSPEPLLRQSLAALFLVHPELAPLAQEAAESLPAQARETLVEAYVAAVYLQTLWRTRLRRHLGEQPALPRLWIEALGLPMPSEMEGRLGLAALHARNKRAGHERVPGHLFGQLLADRSRGPANAAAA
jgi:hypothetical protein